MLDHQLMWLYQMPVKTLIKYPSLIAMVGGLLLLLAMMFT